MALTEFHQASFKTIQRAFTLGFLESRTGKMRRTSRYSSLNTASVMLGSTLNIPTG